MRYLITGGAGFIGSRVAAQYIENRKHLDVCWIIDSLCYPADPSRLGYNRFRPSIYNIDVADKNLMRDFFKAKRPDIVFHLAAESSVDRSFKTPDLFVRTNVLGTQTVLDCCREFKVRRLVHVSTDEVYGSTTLGAPAHEDTKFSPQNPYAASKAAGDLLAQTYATTFGIDVVIVRPTNNFGIKQHPEKVLPKFVAQCVSGNKITIHGSGKQERDFIHVDETAAVLWRLGHLQSLTGLSVFNLSAYNFVSVNKLATLILETIGRRQSSKVKVDDRITQDSAYTINSKKLRDLLGWEPTRSNEASLVNCIRWYEALGTSRVEAPWEAKH